MIFRIPQKDNHPRGPFEHLLVTMPSNAEVRRSVEDAVEESMQTYDRDQLLSFEDYNTILEQIADSVFERMLDDERPSLNESDREYIDAKVSIIVQDYLDRYEGAEASGLTRPPRFGKGERVVCRIGGEHGWAPGGIMALNEDDPSDRTGRTKLPYVVKVDAPISRLISVPYDEDRVCRAEVCFGKDALQFTLRCRPQKASKTMRFSVGERVACAVEAADGDDYTVWAPGKVVDVHYDVQQEAPDLSLSDKLSLNVSGTVPYRVLLDSGAHVLVHRDVHWLVRDLALQGPGPRQRADGTRQLKRMVKRRRDTTHEELIDQETRKVRIQSTDMDGESDSDDD